MTQNILTDVSKCLRDAMDTMFSTDQHQVEQLGTDNFLSMINKRKLPANEQPIYQENTGDNVKRLCTTHNYPYEQKT